MFCYYMTLFTEILHLVAKVMSSIFSRNKLMIPRFISKLMDVYLMAGVHQQPDQSNYLAEGQT